MPDGKLTFDTKLNTAGFEEGKKEIEKEADDLDKKLDQTDATVEVKADTSQAEQAVDNLNTEIHEVLDDPVELPIDTDPTEDATEDIKEDLEDVRKTAKKTSEGVSDNVGTAAKSAESKVESSTAHIEESLKKVQSGFKKLLAAAGITFSVAAITKFGKESVEAAAQVNAANSQLAQAFGELQGNATDAMKRVADASGIVETRLQGVGTSIYAFARTSGMETTQALGMMEDALQVAADSAAYYDRSLEDTSETLMSFLKGNYANDAALGLSATETTRNAAANKLYGKSFQELSEAQKQLTLLQMVKDANALSGAEGQAAREAEGWENVIGNLKEAWRQFLAVVGQPILKVVISWVQELTQALVYLTEKAKIAFNTIGALFGKEIEDTGEATENITQSVSAQEDLTDAVEDTAKAESKSLAGFDKINTVASNQSASAGKSGGGASSVTSPKITVKDNTTQTSKKLENFLKKVKRVCLDTVKAFKAVNKYLTNTFAPSFKKVWELLSPQINRFYDNVKKVFSDIQKLGPPLLSYFNGQFVPMLQTFVETSGEIIAGLFDSFNTVFADIWNIAVFPMLEAFISDGLPIVTEFVTEAIKSFGVFFTEVKKLFDMLWEDAAAPALGLISKVWQDTMHILKDFWDKYGAVVFDKFRTAIKKTGEALQTVWKSIFKPIFDKLMSTLDELWTNHGAPLLKNILDFVGTLASLALDIYNNFIAPLVKWFAQTFGPVISGVFNGLLDVISPVTGGIIDALSNLWSAAKNLLELIQYVFKGNWKAAWTSIKNIFGDIWNALIDVVKAPINAIIGFINAFMDAIEKALNFLIDGVNKFSIDIPDWVPKIGGKTFGFNIKHVNIEPIPLLAQGTVVPANYGNFLAMLGDNKREPEVVSPLSTIEKAVENALARMNGKDQTIHVHVDLDGREIGKVAVKAVRDDNARKGVA